MRLVVFILIGTVLMYIPIVLQSIWYKIKIWKSVVITLLLTTTGVLGTYLMFFIENHRFGGISFYGAVFIVPVLFFVYAKIIKEHYTILIDLCAPAECVMLVIMKINCLVSGCCGGVVIHVSSTGHETIFPSQIAEMLSALILCLVLLYLSKRIKKNGYIYPWFLIMYGFSRLVLNFFRREFWVTEKFLPFGTIWSIVSVVIGVLWILLYKRYKKVENRCSNVDF